MIVLHIPIPRVPSKSNTYVDKVDGQGDLNLGIDSRVNSKDVTSVVISGDWQNRRLDLLNDAVEGFNGIE